MIITDRARTQHKKSKSEFDVCFSERSAQGRYCISVASNTQIICWGGQGPAAK